eukprot:scaffold11234_cov57-Phaeocystis_antarctica.AAC.2
MAKSPLGSAPVVPQLGSCAASKHAWRLRHGSALPGERPAHWAPSHWLWELTAPRSCGLHIS